MPAVVDTQAVMLLAPLTRARGGSELASAARAVCWDHGAEDSPFIASWQGDAHVHILDKIAAWNAAADAMVHNLWVHPDPRPQPTFDELLRGEEAT